MARGRSIPGAFPAPFNPIPAAPPPAGPQFARPDGDAPIGAWEDELGGTVDIYQSIDEVTPSDVDYVTSEPDPIQSPYVVSLSDVESPVAASGDRTVRYRYRKGVPGAAVIDVTVELREGYVSEVSPGALIASKIHEDVPDAFTDGSFVITAEDDTISDYSDLYIRLVANRA